MLMTDITHSIYVVSYFGNLDGYPITNQHLSLFHHFFPPNLVLFQLKIKFWFPTPDVNTFKCSFSLLISKQGFRKSSEIALFSTVLQPGFFTHAIRQSLSLLWCFFLTSAVKASIIVLRKSFFLSFFPHSCELHPGIVTGSASVISSVTGKISQEELVKRQMNKYVNKRDCLQKAPWLLFLLEEEMKDVLIVPLLSFSF